MLAVYRALYAGDPDHVVFVSSPLAGAFAAGLVPLFHNDSLGVSRAPADLGAEAAAPAGLVEDLHRQMTASIPLVRHALPRGRENLAEDRLWSAVYAAVEESLGREAAEECYVTTFHQDFLQWDEAIMDGLENDLPDDWYGYRDVFSVSRLCDSRWAGILAELGVPGLEGWQPFVEAARVTDHFWVRPGYLVVCDPAEGDVDGREDSAWPPPALRWPDGWEVCGGARR